MSAHRAPASPPHCPGLPPRSSLVQGRPLRVRVDEPGPPLAAAAERRRDACVIHTIRPITTRHGQQDPQPQVPGAGPGARGRGHGGGWRRGGAGAVARGTATWWSWSRAVGVRRSWAGLVGGAVVSAVRGRRGTAGDRRLLLALLAALPQPAVRTRRRQWPPKGKAPRWIPHAILPRRPWTWDHGHDLPAGRTGPHPLRASLRAGPSDDISRSPVCGRRRVWRSSSPS